MKALIIGVDGQIGRALVRGLASAGIDWVGTSRRPTAGARVLPFDLQSPEGLSSLPATDTVFICAAMTNQAECRVHPELSHRVNVEVPVAIGAKFRAQGARIVFLSSTAVFDGSQPFRREDDSPSPRTKYGADKVEAEQRMLALGGTSVLRLAKVLTPEFPLISGWIEAISNGRPVKPYHDMTIAPIGVDQVVSALLALGGRGEGIFHQSGASEISYAEIARHLARSLDADPSLVQPMSSVEAGIADVDRQEHSSLSCERLSSLTGFVPPQPTELIDQLFQLGRRIRRQP